MLCQFEIGHLHIVMDDFPSAESGVSWLELLSSADTRVAQQPDGLPCMQYTSCCLPEPVDGCRTKPPVIVGVVLMNTSSLTDPYLELSPNLKNKTQRSLLFRRCSTRALCNNHRHFGILFK